MLLVEEREVCLKLMRSGAEFAYFGEFVAAGGLHLHDLSPQERFLFHCGRNAAHAGTWHARMTIRQGTDIVFLFVSVREEGIMEFKTRSLLLQDRKCIPNWTRR